MKKSLIFILLILLMATLLSGCVEQAKAPSLESSTQNATSTDTSTTPQPGEKETTPLAGTTDGEETAATSAPGEDGSDTQPGKTETPPAAATTATTETTGTTATAATAVTETAPAETVTANQPAVFSQTAAPLPGEKIAILETDYGTIKLRLFTDKTPEMAKNFEQLANTGKYNDVPFHRVVKNFMIQTGDFTAKNGTGGYSYKGSGTTLNDEITPDLKHLYGTVSMANRGANTNGSQFFIVTNKEGTAFLDGGYTVFGQVFEGMDIVEKIQNLQIPGTEKPSAIVNIKTASVAAYQP